MVSLVTKRLAEVVAWPFVVMYLPEWFVTEAYYAGMQRGERKIAAKKWKGPREAHDRA